MLDMGCQRRRDDAWCRWEGWVAVRSGATTMPRMSRTRRACADRAARAATDCRATAARRWTPDNSSESPRRPRDRTPRRSPVRWAATCSRWRVTPPPPRVRRRSDPWAARSACPHASPARPRTVRRPRRRAAGSDVGASGRGGRGAGEGRQPLVSGVSACEREYGPMIVGRQPLGLGHSLVATRRTLREGAGRPLAPP